MATENSQKLVMNHQQPMKWIQKTLMNTFSAYPNLK